MWKKVLTFAEKRILGGSIKNGTLVKIDSDTPTAVISADGGEFKVNFEWSLHIPHLREVMEYGVAFRIDCEIVDKTVVSLSVSIDEKTMCDELEQNGHISGEVHVVGLLMDIWRDARVPIQANEFMHEECAMFSHDTNAHWNANFPLYRHQLHSVAWLRCNEEENTVFHYHGNLALGDTGWFVDTENEYLTQDPSWREAVRRGGILSDGTGTGKTATILYHISSERKGPTLVIVPVNLVSQWKTEVDKFCTSLKTIYLVQSKDLKGTSYHDLTTCHIVLTTFHFLRTCKPYSDLVDTVLDKFKLGRTRCRVAFAAMSRIRQLEEPIVEAVRWHRIVVDEVHNVFQSQRELRQLKVLQSEFCVGLTATPDYYTDLAQQYYWLLKREKAHHPNMLHQLLLRGIHCSHVNEEYPTPNLNLVQLTAEERLQLQSQESILDPEEIVQLCSFVPVSDDVQSCDADSLANEFGAHRQRQVSVLEAEVAEHDKSIVILEHAAFELDSKIICLAESENDDRKRVQLEVAKATSEQHAKDLARFREARDMSHAKLERIRRSIDFVAERLNVLRGRNQSCSICMSQQCESILPCGHLFCSSCIRRHLRNNATCPECRRAVQVGDVCGVTLGGIGSKLMQIVQLIRSVDDPIIMFVQWKSMMRGMKAFLKGMAIQTLNLEGTVTQRAATLDQFKSGGVLLLCLEESFAGLHLPHAKVVIFSHAIVGDTNSVSVTERQAIARCVRQGQTAEVKVHSFVVSECYEETIWRQTHDGSATIPMPGYD